MPPAKSHDSLPDNVLLTGATRGLGLALAERLVGEGYSVIGVARSCTPEFSQLVTQRDKHAGRAHFVEYDLFDLDGIHDLVKAITTEHGGLYGLVNNAALGVDGVLATLHARDIERTLRVNLHAPIHLVKYASRSMIPRKRGRIVNISSIIAVTGFSGLSVYAATKAGLEGMTRSLARELGRVGITVNCVAPGFMETDMTLSLQGEKLESIKRRCPLGLAQLGDVAGAVSYLLGPDAGKVTGTVLTVDGGSTA
jgi:3-oxoacyl-[acyl-carrier protein] reductase